MSQLDQTLSAWYAARRGATAQVNLHRSLGFQGSCLPSARVLRHAALAALGIRANLESEVEPYLDQLAQKGAIEPGTTLGEMNTGNLMVIASSLPVLSSVADLVQSMGERAQQADLGPSNERAPQLDVPQNIRASYGQDIEIAIRCNDTARLYVSCGALGANRAMIRPANRLTLSMTLIPGELTVFAENEFGYHKIVRELIAGEVPESARNAHRERSL